MTRDLILHADGSITERDPDPYSAVLLNGDDVVPPLIIEGPGFVGSSDDRAIEDDDDFDNDDDFGYVFDNQRPSAESEQMADVLMDAAAELDGELDVPPAATQDLTPLLWEAAEMLDEGAW